jgi:hypothetical protein
VSSAPLISWIGLAILIVGVILSNLAVWNMAKILNSERDGLGKVHWDVKNDRASRKVLRLYRAKHGNGPLYKQFKLALLICGVGAVLMFSDYFLRNYRF